MDTALMEQQAETLTGEPQTVEELCKQIVGRRTLHYAARSRPYPRSNPIASDISDCMRETVLGITNWQDRPEFPVDALERMERGNKVEDWIMLELQELGYRVSRERKPFELKDKKGRVISRGKVDGYIEIGRKSFPFECKSMHPSMYARVYDQEDFDRFSFYRKYPRQLQSYLLAENLEQGFWICDDLMGHWKLIPCRLDLDRAEKVLQHIEGAVEHLANGTLPDFHKDPQVCLKCWAFKRVCMPGFSSGEGMQVLDDQELGAKLARLKELEDAATEYDRYDREVKTFLKAAMCDKQTFIIGDFLVSADEKTRKMKAQPAKDAHEQKYLSFEIERLPY